jgi:hypothetical protein
MQRLLDRISDEDLGRDFCVLWERYWIENVPFTINGASVPQIPDDQLKLILPAFKGLIRVASLNQDTNNYELMGLEKALHLYTSGDYTRVGKIFRAYTEHRDEAKTGRRRQSTIARKKRPGRRSYLHEVLRDIATVTSKWEEALKELHRRAEPSGNWDEPHIERVSEAEGVEWHEQGKSAHEPAKARDLPISKVKAIFYKEHDAVRKMRKKAESR